MSVSEIKIQWQPGFVAAIDLELSANRKDLIYEKEYNLNTKPLEIDLLVIKKEKDVRIENPCPGTYYVLDGVLFPTQIIVTKELDSPEHTWLKSLSGKLKKKGLKDIL